MTSEDMTEGHALKNTTASSPQQLLLGQIWRVFARSRPLAWPKPSAIHLRSSRAEVLEVLKDMPVGLALQADGRYTLTLLGLLNSQFGQVLEDLLVDYIAWLRGEAARNPDIGQISSDVICAALEDVSE